MKKLHIRYTVYLSVGIFLVLASLSAASYAFYDYVTGQDEDNVYSTLSCIDVDITGTSKSLDLKSKYPLLNNKGIEEDSYSFKVTNNCEGIIDYNIVLSVLDSSTLENKEYIKVNLNGYENLKPTTLSNLLRDDSSFVNLPNVKDNYILLRESFENEDTHNYNFRMWLNGENESIWNDETLSNQKIEVKLSVVSVASDQMHYNLNKKLKEPYNNIPNLSLSDGVLNEGLNKMNDKYGVSYFFAGKDINNNIVIKDNLYKIVRINGNNTVRLIYDGKLDSDVKHLEENESIQNTLNNFYESAPKDLMVKGYYCGLTCDTYDDLAFTGLLSEAEIVNTNIYEKSYLKESENFYLHGDKYYSKESLIKDISESLYEEIFVKPVINIKENVRVTGEGSLENPFRILD